MDEKTIQQLKYEIDKMSQYEMCRHWRFDPSGSPYFQGKFSNILRNGSKS